MKVALYGLPHVYGGTATWAREVASGFLSLGDEVHLVAHPKEKRDYEKVFLKEVEYTEDLDQFDFIILVYCQRTMDDKKAEKEERLPYYIHALRCTKTPWTTLIHGPHYAKARYLRELFSSPSYVGYYLATAAGYTIGMPTDLMGEEIRAPFLPLAITKELLPGGTHKSVKMTSRIAGNKGQAALCLAADLINPDVDIQLYGDTIVGGFPSGSGDLWKKLIEKGAKCSYEVNIFKAEPWVITYGGHWINYEGPFRSETNALIDTACHVNLTSNKFTWGHLEYSTLAAFLRGIPCVVPAHMDIVGYPDFELPVFSLRYYESVRKHNREELGNTINFAIRHGPPEPANLAEWRDIHSPAKYVKLLTRSYTFEYRGIAPEPSNQTGFDKALNIWGSGRIDGSYSRVS